MDERLRTDLFCSLLMANRIMTGKQILKAVTEEKLASLGEFWDRRDELISSDRITSAQMEKWSHFKESPAYLRIEEYVEYVSKRKICSMNRLDDEYPEYMSHLTNMPLVLFYKGDISLLDKGKTRVCIVGTRRPSAYGRRVTRDFSGTLSKHDLVIVSGLARGVDTCAHEACLANHGKTIAVMPCGLDKIYPQENHELYNRIAEEGLLISELLPGTEPIRQYFPARNRILSAISDCVLITEAGKNSGTLHTASFAATQGREVFAVPSIIYSDTAQGNLSLLKDGASVATEPEDVLTYLAKAVFFRELEEIKDEYDRRKLDKKVRETPELLTSEDVRRILYDLLSSCEMSVEEIIEESGLPYRTVVSELGKMELQGQITKERQKYVLTIRF
ncbi:MAG TPA: DNA-protecting protein DprA [Clostridiales bacterium]|nr:DNA-protecting protein DprA [Clostridiales bacterium]